MAVVKKYRGSKEEPRLSNRSKTMQTASYDNLSYQSTKKKFRFICLEKDHDMFTPDDLHDCVLRLHKYCLTHLLDSYRVHLNRLKGVKVLNELVDKVYFDDLKISQIVRIIWCSISIVHHFHIRLKVGKGFSVWNRRRQAELANESFDRVMQLLLPDLFSTIIHSIVTFFEEARLWDTELLCSDLINRVLKFCMEHARCVNVLLDVVESSSANDARKVLRVIYDILEIHEWKEMDEELLNRLLTMFRCSIIPNENNETAHLKGGLEVCIRRMLRNINNTDLLKVIEIMLTWTLMEEITDEALLDFGNILEFASILHITYLYKYSLTESIFSNILTLIASDNLLNSLLGHRILQNLLDRHNNKAQFDLPRIYFQNTHFNINVGEYYSEDKFLLKEYREPIHLSFLTSVEKHGRHRIHLESTYITMAIFVIEVPCGYNAASMVCLAMAIQETTISDDFIELECSNRIHACVMAIMSLICWVHSAEVFYDYLNTIIQRRAEFAPHLNPPIQTMYQYARHHILWSKPELFFEDWEVRYGLWKCFRGKKKGEMRESLITNSTIKAPDDIVESTSHAPEPETRKS